jgi:hypothetical protein
MEAHAVANDGQVFHRGGEGVGVAATTPLPAEILASGAAVAVTDAVVFPAVGATAGVASVVVGAEAATTTTTTANNNSNNRGGGRGGFKNQ